MSALTTTRYLRDRVLQATVQDGDHVKYIFNVDRVLVSYFISFMGAYMCCCVCEQLRMSYIVGRGNFYNDLKWFLMMGISLGGIGIWCMHFIGMSALTLIDTTTNETIHVSFNIAVSVSSLIVVIITTTAGVMIAANDPMFMKSKGEILEMFLQDTSHLSMAEVRQLKNFRLLKLISTKSLGYLVAGGFVAGAGVSIMHFIGMNAMRMQSKIEWNAGIVFIAVVIAIVASTAAFWILFRLLSLFPIKEYLRLASSFIMGIAVCGMHYTGMIAASFKGEIHHEAMVSSKYMDREESFVPVVLTVIFLVTIIIIVVLADLRLVVHKFHQQTKRLISPAWKFSEDRGTISRLLSSMRNMKIYSSNATIVQNDEAAVVSVSSVNSANGP